MKGENSSPSSLVRGSLDRLLEGGSTEVRQQEIEEEDLKAARSQRVRK